MEIYYLFEKFFSGETRWNGLYILLKILFNGKYIFNRQNIKMMRYLRQVLRTKDQDQNELNCGWREYKNGKDKNGNNKAIMDEEMVWLTGFIVYSTSRRPRETYIVSNLCFGLTAFGIRRCTMMYDVVSGSNPLGMLWKRVLCSM